MSVKLKGRFRLGLLAVPRGAASMTHQVFFSGGKRPELVATDGKMMVVIPVDPVKGATQETVRVDGRAFGIATANQKPDEERQLTVKDGHILVKDDRGREMLSVPSGKPEKRGLPENYRKFIPEPRSQEFALALDPRLVLKMAKVLGDTDRIVIHGDVNAKHGVVHKPLRVTSGAWDGNDKPHGVMIPTVIEEDRRGRNIAVEAKK